MSTCPENYMPCDMLCTGGWCKTLHGQPPEGQVSAITAHVTIPKALLEEVVSALDRGLGDSDITHLETDEEIREEAPIQWACSKLSAVLAASISISSLLEMSKDGIPKSGKHELKSGPKDF